MASKIYTPDLKVGMFVADLDRPCVDTPFLLQGFLIENEEQILALRTHCEYVIVDRARSTGSEFQAPPASAPNAPRTPAGPLPTRPSAATSPASDGDKVTHVTPPQPGDKPMRTARFPASVPYRSRQAGTVDEAPEDEPGLFGRLFGRLKGSKRPSERSSAAPVPEVPRETPQEFAARAELLPPGIPVQTYVDQV